MQERASGTQLAQRFNNWEDNRQKKIEVKRMEKEDPDQEELTFQPDVGRENPEPIRSHDEFLRD